MGETGEVWFTKIKDGNQEITNFKIGAKVIWKTKKGEEIPFYHPMKRHNDNGPFEVIEITVEGKINANPCALGKFVDQVVRIKTIPNGKNDQKINVIDVSSSYLDIFVENTKKKNKKKEKKNS